jgi:hypothetical protein
VERGEVGKNKSKSRFCGWGPNLGISLPTDQLRVRIFVSISAWLWIVMMGAMEKKRKKEKRGKTIAQSVR